MLEEFSNSPVYQLARSNRRSSGSETASRQVAESLLYVGHSGQGSEKRRPYSCLRIDVLNGCPPKFRVRLLVAERFEGKWLDSSIEPFVI